MSHREWRLVRAGARTRAPLTLDETQRRIVGHRSGPMLVRGAAGTGKTATLIEAVAARVEEGVDPQRILVLTFSRRGAQTLRERIEARVTRTTALRGRGVSPREEQAAPLDAAGPVSSSPVVRTFPAFAFGLLRRASVRLGDPPPRLLSAPEQDLVIRELLPGESVHWPEHLGPALGTRAFAEQLRDLILRAAERGVPVDDPLWAVRADWAAAAEFLVEYEQTMALREAATRGAIGYDHAELVRAATYLLDSEPSVLAEERGSLDFIYVDELADTDPAQIELLERVASTVVAFGDADSSTFAFRGADPTIMRTFPDQFPGTVSVTLEHVYRGAPAVEAYALRSRGSEAAYVAQRLRQAHLADGVPWSRMAVVMRSASNQLATYERALRHAGVPTVVHAEDLPVHQQPAVKPFLLLLRCALDPAALTEETAVALLHSPLGGADPLAERRLRQGLRAMAGPEHNSGDLIVAALKDPTELVALERRWSEPAVRIANLIRVARAAAGLAPIALSSETSPERPEAGEYTGTAEDVLWAVWRASGLADRWAAIATKPAVGAEQQRRAETADRDLDAIMVLFDAAARFTDRLPGARVDLFLEHVAGQQLPADSIAGTGDRGESVRLLTAHAAKGLEWDVVMVAGVQEGLWPDLRLRGSLLGSEQLVDEVTLRAAPNAKAQRVAQTTALLKEERRLFHVATTRARKRVIVTAVDSSAVGGADGEDRPSRFLHEILSRRNPPPNPGSPGPNSPGPNPSGPNPSGPSSGPTAGPPQSGPPQSGPPQSGPPQSGPSGSSGGAVGASAVSGGAVSGGSSNGDSATSGGNVPTAAPAVAAQGNGGAAAGGVSFGGGSAEGGSAGGGSAGGGAKPAALGEPPELMLVRPSRPLTLAGLVAELRVAAMEGDEDAAAELARLAEAGVPGAHPDEWWGLASLSDDRPLRDADDEDPVRVTPSTMESALRCGLRWLLEKHGGSAPATGAQGVGNLVHAAAMLADQATNDPEVLLEYVAARFDAIELAARWLVGRERDRADEMIGKLVKWLADNPRRLVDVEREFTVRLEAHPPIELTGRVDRLEVDDDGRLVVIDLKTGKTTTATAAELPEHPQLGAYQVAVEEGAFAEGTISGGAALVQLGTTHKEAKEQAQDALHAAEDPRWAHAMVHRTAETMAASTFVAKANDSCRVCPVKTSCPVSGKGRQVVEP